MLSEDYEHLIEEKNRKISVLATELDITNKLLERVITERDNLKLELQQVKKEQETGE